MRAITGAALAAALFAIPAAAAAADGPVRLGAAEMDRVTAGALVNLDLHVPITIQDVDVTLKDINVNAVANVAVVAPILSVGGTNNVTIRQGGRIRFRRR